MLSSVHDALVVGGVQVKVIVVELVVELVVVLGVSCLGEQNGATQK